MARKGKAQTQEPEESVASQLHRDILAGQLRPGEWLKQADLEERYDANRFEVRMALSTVNARHLIEHIPNRGYRVINPSDREREELYEVRIILETAAARMVAQKCTEQDIDELGDMVEQFAAAIDTANVPELSAMNAAFHNRFYEVAGNSLLVNQIRELRDRGHPGRGGSWQSPASIRVSAQDHREMVDMLKRRDGEGLGYVVYRHLNRYRDSSVPLYE